MQTIPFNELRAHLAQTLREVEATREPVVISRRGKAAAVLMSWAQYERLREPEFDLGAALDAWRAGAAAGAAESDDDDPWAAVRDADPAGGRAPVDFNACPMDRG